MTAPADRMNPDDLRAALAEFTDRLRAHRDISEKMGRKNNALNALGEAAALRSALAVLHDLTRGEFGEVRS